MTDDEFATLVNRLEESARSKPALYRWRVMLLAIVGNAYLLLVLMLLAALLFASLVSLVFLKALAVKIILPVAIFFWAVVRALWVSLPAPQGIRVTRREAPELFKLIDTLRKRAHAPAFHRVLITDELNAAVAQRPRLGIFGWYRNYLLIGLPLMKLLTVEQFAAVLAHELGHLAGGHGRLSTWIYRQRLRWSQLMDLFSEGGQLGSFLFTPFLNRFAPYFNAYSFPLARANEYEADAAAAHSTTPTVAAEALTAVHVLGSYLSEQYWPGIYRQADEVPQPAFTPYRELHAQLAATIPAETIDGWVARAMEQKTGLSDTHPSLKERLAALAEAPCFAPPAPGRSAETLLGGVLAAITERFDREWLAMTEQGWKQRYEEVSEGRQRLAELEQQLADGAEPSAQEGYDRALLTERYGAGADAALALFEALQQRLPEDAVVSYALGARLLLREDERGVALLESAMGQDADLTGQCAEALRDYHWRNGREVEAHRWHDRLVQFAEIERLAAREREQILVSDKFEQHDLNNEELQALLEQLKTIRGLGKVYLVRKQVKYHPERPLYLLGFTTRFTFNRKRQRTEVQRHIVDDVRFPVQALILNVEGANYRFGRKLRWMRGSRIL